MELELRILWAAIVTYVLGGSLAIFGVVLKKRPERAVLALVTLGLLLHTASLGVRWERLGHGPFITLFEILSSNLWSLTLAFVLAYWRIPQIRPAAAVLMPILFVMMGWLMLSHPGEGHFPPTYRTPWLYIHIGFGKVFLGAVLVAVGISGVVLLRSAGIGVEKFARLPDNARLDELSFRLMAVGLIFETLMLVAGAIWAQDAWGRYWAWDPLETWAFLTWLALAFALHARITFKTRPQTGAVMIIVVFVLAFLTFFGVPFISTSPHKGAI
ncbi:MAG TPA: cytochrome c biogenesis protein CcsA [Burkholderiales bacterium]|nr:cytochrome c biogenesis protein CcsA [Burkholderiales bacterium]